MTEEVKACMEKQKAQMEAALQYLEKELGRIRAGKASPQMLEGIRVDYYGNMTPLDQVGAINTPDARQIVVQPWEKKMIPVIEKAIMDANIGLTPQNNGEHIRCAVPPLTEERRKELIKKVKTAGENSKIVIRNARRDAIDALKKAQKDGLPEDVQKDYEQNVQKETDAYVKKVDDLCAAKEKDILTV